MELFKTLQFRNKAERQMYGNYVMIVGEHFAGGAIPQLMTMKTTMTLLQEIYPKNDFSSVELVTLKISKNE